MQWNSGCPLLIKNIFSGAGFEPVTVLDMKDAALTKAQEGLAFLDLLSTTHYVPGTVLETLLMSLFNQYRVCHFQSNPIHLNKRKSKNMLGVWGTVQGSRRETGGGSCWAHRDPGARLEEKDRQGEWGTLTAAPGALALLSPTAHPVFILDSNLKSNAFMINVRKKFRRVVNGFLTGSTEVRVKYNPKSHHCSILPQSIRGCWSEATPQAWDIPTLRRRKPKYHEAYTSRGIESATLTL